MIYYEYENVVRDYECDVQGIVNNAVYMNYCECARNLCIAKLGYNLMSLHERGEDPVVVHAELNFKHSLAGGDEYCVVTELEKKGNFRLLFHQKIFVSQICALEARYTVVVLNQNKKPIPIEESVFARLWKEKIM